MNTAPSAILWDWDNTLADGWGAMTAAINVTFKAFDMPPWTEAEMRARARLSLRESFPGLFGEKWERAASLFGQAYALCQLDHLRPMPGAEAAIAAGRRFGQAVVSNKAGSFLRRECTHLGWDGYFAAVIGAGDAAADKPDPASLVMALAGIGVAAGPCVWYVGDTGVDMQAARNLGVTAVLVGNADHDGGVLALKQAGLDPDLHFVDAEAVGLYLAGLA